MAHLARLSLAATGIVMGGVTLGAALAAFANPMPKPLAPAPWEGRLHPQIVASGAQAYYQSLPEDLYPASLPSSYVPASALTEMRWPDSVAMPRFAEPVRLSEFAPPANPDDSWNPQALAERTVTVPHYAAMEQQPARDQTTDPVAPSDEAPVKASDDPADLAVSVDPAAPPPLPAPQGSPKMIHLASAED